MSTNNKRTFCCACDCFEYGWKTGSFNIVWFIAESLTLVYGILSFIILYAYNYNDIITCYNEQNLNIIVSETQYKRVYGIVVITILKSLIILPTCVYIFYCISKQYMDSKCNSCHGVTVIIALISFAITAIGWFTICPAFGLLDTQAYLGYQNVCIRYYGNSTLRLLADIDVVFITATVFFPVLLPVSWIGFYVGRSVSDSVAWCFEFFE